MRSRGFTLVELIATMVILGIISVMTSKFIVNGFSFYVDATNIQKISTTANFVAEKMEKLIENSVPNSIVISETGESITFVPIKGALGYTYIPKNPLSAFDNKPVLYAVTTAFDRSNIKKGAFVAFNNYGSNEEYYQVLDVTVNGNVTAVTIDAPSSKKFTPGSERGRLYFVDGQNRYITVKLENSQQPRIFWPGMSVISGSARWREHSTSTGKLKLSTGSRTRILHMRSQSIRE